MPNTMDSLEQQNEGSQSISPPIDGDPESRMKASIQERLNGVASLASRSCIYRVPEKLRKINEEAYTPQVASIGPFHHGKRKLRVTETDKLQYLRSFVDRRPDIAWEEYYDTMKRMEERTRQCYAEIISISSAEFVEMMLLDGCFILEFLLRNSLEVSHRGEDPVSSNLWLSNAIKCDFILLENQLPLFVLESLYNLNRRDRDYSLSQIISFSFPHMVPKVGQGLKENFKSSQVNRQQDCCCCCCSSSSSSCALLRENKVTDSVSTTVDMADYELAIITSQIKHLLDFVRHSYIPVTSSGNENKLVELPPNVSQLREAGIKFEVGIAKCLLDISLKKGVLAIPFINIGDWTESLFRNMIAFEQLHCVGPKFITDYVTLLNSFVGSSKDVILLQEEGIINSLLGDHERVPLIFNKLANEVNIDHQDFYFSDICLDLNTYYSLYRVTWHAWKANLIRTYFNAPWTVISVIAAVVMLVLSFLETIYSIN
ncbi:hypothetical protein NE237_027397 [Protea cynaroides]|uniref:Uncharacterized protein n=1 Tax=Protea cynaroides TaxID=273540 RepID=A0A9Q0GNB9_9MAGN|nr:hypothetical protein NE237_027397 [Protea cynaroides]